MTLQPLLSEFLIYEENLIFFFISVLYNLVQFVIYEINKSVFTLFNKNMY
jgi:hypothetical protein